MSKEQPTRYFILLLTAIGLSSSAWADGADFRFTPKEPLLDDPVKIQVNGLTPGSTVIVRASAMFAGQTWRSWASFLADEKGVIDLAQKPINGSYRGANAMGLFLFMETAKEDAKKSQPLKIMEPRITHFEAESDGKVEARAELKRWLARPGVRISDIKEKGLVGKLFEPEGEGRRPALLVLSGSDGGIPENEAALLASHGYVAFALAYFKAEGLPGALVKIPLEYLKTGIDWLAARDRVDAKRLGVVGGSKGGELALLLAATFPEVKAVVARAPSHVTWAGIGGTYSESGWTFEGKPLPFVKTKPNPAFFKQLSSKEPLRLIDLYRSGLDDKGGEEKALIKVEKINGAVLLISGKDDLLWPASEMSDKVVARLKAHKHPFPVEHLCYEKAGHGIPSSYFPSRLTLGLDRMAMGGTTEANADALTDSRPKVLRFLEKNLKERQ